MAAPHRSSVEHQARVLLKQLTLDPAMGATFYDRPGWNLMGTGRLPSGSVHPQELAKVGIKPPIRPGITSARGIASPASMKNLAQMGAMSSSSPAAGVVAGRRLQAAELLLLRELQEPGPERALTRIGGKATPIKGGTLTQKGVPKSAKKWLKKLGRMRGLGPAGALILLLGLGLGITGGGSEEA